MTHNTFNDKTQNRTTIKTFFNYLNELIMTRLTFIKYTLKMHCNLSALLL